MLFWTLALLLTLIAFGSIGYAMAGLGRGSGRTGARRIGDCTMRHVPRMPNGPTPAGRVRRPAGVGPSGG
ncbi:hypothetical protein [Streptomyces sp. NBC_00370]|uniref:hypothetical protein n=1 Tax=Streptomyces sp. NBC_00370 TaxID=2975728 RepID=UPI002E270AC8